MIGTRYRLPAVDDRGAFDILIPDGSPELTYADALLAGASAGYPVTPEQWEARQVKHLMVEVAP